PSADRRRTRQAFLLPGPESKVAARDNPYDLSGKPRSRRQSRLGNRTPPRAQSERAVSRTARARRTVFTLIPSPNPGARVLSLRFRHQSVGVKPGRQRARQPTMRLGLRMLVDGKDEIGALR